jgi:hypothetical protein
MTHDIKELLTLAAKACGYRVIPKPSAYLDSEGRRWTPERDESGTLSCQRGSDESVFEWAPHLDDGECFRMETELEIYFTWDEWPKNVGIGAVYTRTCQASDLHVYESYASHNGDKDAARRLASLRVAAELGRRMPCEQDR